MENDLIYSLNEEDAQTVALENLGRELRGHEIVALKGRIAENINWFDAISNTLDEVIPID